MASLLSSVIVPQVYVPYVLEQSVVKNGLLKSGIVASNPVMSNYLAQAGEGANILTFQNFDANGTSANASSTDPTVQATAQTVTGRKQYFAKVGRNKVFASSNFAAALLNVDPAAVIAANMADVIIQWRQTTLMNILQGCVNSTVASANVNNVAVEATTSYTSTTQINPNTVLETLSALGDLGVRDQMSNVETGIAIFMHSDTYRYLSANDFTSFQRASTQTYGFTTYLGMPVIVDDTLPKVAGTTSGHIYTTYIVRAGAINFGYAVPKNPVGIWEDPRAGNGAGIEYISQRDLFSFHINGFSFTGAPAGDTPTDAELATATNWTQVLTPKQTGVLALVHNCAN
jgi:hypothetical protein